MNTPDDSLALPTRSHVESLLHEQLMHDPDFRGELVSDPHAVLSKLIGIEIPLFVKITLHEESLTDIHVVIPRDRALSDAELDLVAGGAAGGSLEPTIVNVNWN